jgi:hypothetical protein
VHTQTIVWTIALVDVTGSGLSGIITEKALEEGNIIVNKNNLIHYQSLSAFSQYLFWQAQDSLSNAPRRSVRL